MLPSWTRNQFVVKYDGIIDPRHGMYTSELVIWMYGEGENFQVKFLKLNEIIQKLFKFMNRGVSVTKGQRISRR